MSDIEPTVPGPPVPDWADGAPARGPMNGDSWWVRRGILLRFLPLVVLAAVVVGVPLGLISHQASQYYIFSPGTAPVVTASPKCAEHYGNLSLPGGEPCVRVVVPRDKAHPVTGRLYMVDVLEGIASPWQWLRWKLGLLGGSQEVAPISAYLGAVPVSEAGCQDAQQMSQANQYAALAALAALHYKVNEVPLGAQLTGVFAHTPAWAGGLRCNDVITAADGKKIIDSAQLAQYLDDLSPGTVVVLTDKPGGGGPAKTVKVRLAPLTAAPAGQNFQGRSFLGVEDQTLTRAVLPFKVSVNAGDIGGPSAGLAFTLGILDTLSNGKLTGGHRVAATGTIDPRGAVGPVGGVREKTAAVQKAGAQVFFVPVDEYPDAKGVANKGLAVIPVTSLGQVLRILHNRYGGDLSGIQLTG